MVNASIKNVLISVAAITANKIASDHSRVIDFFTSLFLRRKYNPKVTNPKIIWSHIGVDFLFYFCDI